MRLPWFAALLVLAPVAWSKKPAPAPAPAPAPVAAPAPAAETPATIAEYRHEIMEAAGGHTGALFMIIKGESARTGDILAHAEALNAIAQMSGTLWPAGSGPDKVETSSKAEIWTDAAGFSAAVSNFQAKTAALVEAAKGGNADAIKGAAFGMGQSCGDCHDKYRVDEDHH